jgi:hypothetical protein
MKLKKEGNVCCFLAIYGRFLIISTSITSTMITKTNKPAIAGTKQNQQSAVFPAGVPVASDLIMKDWMGYVYQQKPLPSDFSGVFVTINVVDANGNYRTIGTTTTDYSGAYHLTWQPDIPGDYYVIANFAGTNSYWPSSATNAFNVMEEHPTTTPTPEPASTADQYLLPGIIGIIVTIAIVGAVLALLIVKKRP